MSEPLTRNDRVANESYRLHRSLMFFLVKMQSRLETKLQQGWSQWDNQQLISDVLIKEKVIECMNKGDAEDAANYLMFLDHRKQQSRDVSMD